ncbi:MAG: alpha/beta fold hydrolase [Bacteroidales bacterium]|nr:alpha/beta fold hydrolase [Bacteroidales bacterium]
MKKTTFLFLIVLMTLTVSAQNITGHWNGVLKVSGIQLRVVFNITKTDTGYTSTMDSPDQGAKGIPVTSTSFENSILDLKVSNAGIEYKGEYNSDSITGTFTQRGQSLPMNLKRDSIEKPKLIRPQEPVKPYPYYSEEVTFRNLKANLLLSGTLTLPEKEGNFPVVVLISGSGPQNRDEELLGHKPFLVLSDYLTRNGIAVLRYDDRGVAKSEGDFKTATSLDFASDVEAAVSYLKTRKEIDKKKIGIIGHSEGGLIAPMVASKSKDVSFIVLLAGTGIPGNQLLLLQQELIGKASGVSESDLQKTHEINSAVFDLVIKCNNTDTLRKELTGFLVQKLKESPDSQKPAGVSDTDFVKLQVDQILNPWMQYFIRYNPAPALEKVNCRVLALNGGKDLQVPPGENLPAIKAALLKGGNKNVTTKEFSNLNHLFQECKTGLPAEYAQIEQTFSPTALEEIVKWIKLK